MRFLNRMMDMWTGAPCSEDVCLFVIHVDVAPAVKQPHDPDLAKSWVDAVSNGATVAPSCHRFVVTFLIPIQLIVPLISSILSTNKKGYL